jgi:signal transduction histidine kinase
MAVLGHELRSPLTVLRGAATLLLDQESPLPADRQIEMLRLIDLQVQIMSGRIEDIHTVVALAGGTLRLELEPVAMAPAIATAVEARRRQEPDRPLLASAPDGLSVRADAVRLGQVLAALLSNASRFSPAGSRVEIITREQGEVVRVAVADAGPGVEPALRAAIFERFRRLDPGTGGAGIGLYLVRELILGMGGEVGVEGRPDGGSEFWFTLKRDG